MLVTPLPPESASGHNWDDLEYMIAEMLDVVKFHRIEWASAHGAKPPEPQPTARPKVPERDGVTGRELARAAHQHILEQVGMGAGE